MLARGHVLDGARSMWALSRPSQITKDAVSRMWLLLESDAPDELKDTIVNVCLHWIGVKCLFLMLL